MKGEKSAGNERPPVVVVMGHVDHGKCVHPDTAIPLADGSLKTAKELWKEYAPQGKNMESFDANVEVVRVTRGPKVWSWDGKEMRLTRASHLWKIQNNNPLCAISLSSGDIVTVTPEHPFLTFGADGKKRYKPAREIHEGDFIVVPQLLPFNDASLASLKREIMERLAEAKGFVAFLSDVRAGWFFQKLRRENLQELYRKGLFSTHPSAAMQKRRFRIADLVKLVAYFNIDLAALYDVISGIKNADEKWRAGHTSNVMRLAKTKKDFAELAYCIGLVIGDGHLDNHEVSFHNNDPELQDVYRACARNVLGLTPTLKYGHTAWMVMSGGGKTLVRFLNVVYGIPIGQKSGTVRIPELLCRMKETRRAVVAGVFDTDGGVSPLNHSLELVSKSRQLVRDIGVLLLEYGVHAAMFEKNDYWGIRVANHPYLARFMARYPLRHLKKQTLLRVAIKKASTSRIFDKTPISGEALKGIPVSGKLFPYFERYMSYPRLSRQFLANFFAQFQDAFTERFSGTDLKPLINPGEISLVQVTKKSTQRTPVVYDFSIPQFKNFVAERAIIHNTTLLDFIRKTNVAAKEAGGITQSVGAYEIVHANPVAEQARDGAGGAPPPGGSGNANAPTRMGRKITFIDTPGHEAFSKMRARGAKIADVAVIVVAADDGVQPQTLEAVKIAREAKVKFIIAINKIDRPGVDITKVKNDLTKNNILLEGYGGDISYQPISGKTGQGVPELLDLILLTAEMEELKCDLSRPASGYVLESKMDSRRGPAAALIVKDGTLREGDGLSAGSTGGRVKVIENFLGKRVREAVPSMPVFVLGFETVPAVGEIFAVGGQAAAPVSRAALKRELTPLPAPSDERTLHLILKGDSSGSLETLGEIIRHLPTPPGLKLEIIDKSVGDISDGDAKTAIPTQAIIVGFRVRAARAAENFIRAHNIRLILGEIIYELVKAIEEELKRAAGISVRGDLEILALFGTKGGKEQIVGGRVAAGEVTGNSPFEIERRGAAAGTGRIINLQEGKKDVPAVAVGKECGLLANAEAEIKVGDHLIFR